MLYYRSIESIPTYCYLSMPKKEKVKLIAIISEPL